MTDLEPDRRDPASPSPAERAWGRGRQEKSKTTVLLPADLKLEAMAYAYDHGTTLTYLIVKGLRIVLGKDGLP